jgi:hypothetical protein
MIRRIRRVGPTQLRERQLSKQVARAGTADQRRQTLSSRQRRPRAGVYPRPYGTEEERPSPQPSPAGRGGTGVAAPAAVLRGGNDGVVLVHESVERDPVVRMLGEIGLERLLDEVGLGAIGRARELVLLARRTEMELDMGCLTFNTCRTRIAPKTSTRRQPSQPRPY